MELRDIEQGPTAAGGAAPAPGRQPLLAAAALQAPQPQPHSSPPQAPAQGAAAAGGGVGLAEGAPGAPQAPTPAAAGAGDPPGDGAATTPAAGGATSARRVKSVRIAAGGAIDRVEFEYQSGKKWSIGGPGGNKGIPPLVLANDEYLEEVRHESLPQWWFAGASIEFRTNKGRIFRHVAGWGSGEEEDMVRFHASPGKCITALQLHEGVLKGIVEEDCHVGEGTDLEMFLVYWLEGGEGVIGEQREVKCPKGHVMREDWSRQSHICDECSRRGTMARCGGGCDYDLCGVCYRHHAEGWASAVRKRGFSSRDAALQFAARRGAGAPGLIVLGPLRVELEDHPWLDATREVRAACGRWARSVRSVWRQGRGRPGLASARDSFLPGALRPPPTSASSASSGAQAPEVGETLDAAASQPAGLVVDVRRGTRVKAWGVASRLAMCEKAAADAGEFNLAAWEKGSSSLRGWVAWFRRTIPLLWRVLSLLDWRRNMCGTAVVAICIAVRAACDGWQPVLTGAVFNLINGDNHEVERESKFLHVLCSWTFGCTGRLQLARSVILGLMLASVVQGLARALGNGVKKAMRDRQSADLKVAMFEHLLAQDQALYDTLRRGDLVAKAEMRAMDQVTEWVWSLAADVVKLATQLVFLFAISPVMTLVYTLLLPALERATRYYLEKGVHAQNRREDGLNQSCHGVVNEAVGMIRTVKTFSREERHVALVSIAAGGAAAAAVMDSAEGKSMLLKRQFRHGAITVFNDTSQRAVYCFCLWCGLVWMERDFSAGDMTAYLLLVQQVGGLAQRVRGHVRDLQRRHDMLQDHFEFMDRTPHLVPGTHTGEVLGHVEFRNVEFHYPARPDTPVLKGVSFEMVQGEMTALVGASGSGKSTVAAMLFRHYDPEVGDILIDGVSLRQWDTARLHARMALVAQQPLLFDTSIRNNLTYGCRREVSDEELHEAARLANAHDFVMGFPAGYDTYVGDQGAHVSGGQKQRLSIARAVILKPQILVLDEATSALDAEAEGVVQDALDTVMVGRTTLVIAHRLSTIKNAHQIVCMRDGRVVESGSPKVLLAKQGYYWNLVRRQVCTLDDLSGFNLEMDQKQGPTEDGAGSSRPPAVAAAAAASLKVAAGPAAEEAEAEAEAEVPDPESEPASGSVPPASTSTAAAEEGGAVLVPGMTFLADGTDASWEDHAPHAPAAGSSTWAHTPDDGLRGWQDRRDEFAAIGASAAPPTELAGWEAEPGPAARTGDTGAATSPDRQQEVAASHFVGEHEAATREELASIGAAASPYHAFSDRLRPGGGAPVPGGPQVGPAAWGGGPYSH